MGLQMKFIVASYLAKDGGKFKAGGKWLRDREIGKITLTPTPH